MKAIVLVLVACLSVAAQAQLFQWAWVSGNNDTFGVAPLYQDRGMPSYVAKPGSRYNHGGWFDSEKREFYIYGGTLYDDNFPNDLWKYRLNDSTWTWISGSETNIAPVYGSLGVADASNHPGSRYGPSTVMDMKNRKLWLFGGLITNSRRGNDLWSYDLDTGMWTWVSGTQNITASSNYGQKGIPSADNYPWPRDGGCAWFNTNTEEFWVFGGYASGPSNNQKYINDLWRYRVADGTWTWMSGNDTLGDLGHFDSSGAYPGARGNMPCWYDQTSDTAFTFGGYGNSVDNTTGNLGIFELNDFWMWNSNKWTWLGGQQNYSRTEVSNFGQLGVKDVSNWPGPRDGHMGWAVPAKRELWFIGGYGNIRPNGLSDIWRFTIDDQMWTWMGGSTDSSSLRKFGKKLLPSLENVPGATDYGFAFYDESTDQVWLHGGYSQVASGYYDSVMVGFLDKPLDSCIDWASGGSLIQPNMCASGFWCTGGFCEVLPPADAPIDAPAAAPVAQPIRAPYAGVAPAIAPVVAGAPKTESTLAPAAAVSLVAPISTICAALAILVLYII